MEIFALLFIAGGIIMYIMAIRGSYQNFINVNG